jgi:hypothetical protein
MFHCFVVVDSKMEPVSNNVETLTNHRLTWQKILSPKSKESYESCGKKYKYLKQKTLKNHFM